MAKKDSVSKKEIIRGLEKFEKSVVNDIVKAKVTHRYQKKFVLPKAMLDYKTQKKGEAKVGRAELDHIRSMIKQLEADQDSLRNLLSVVREELETASK